MVASDIFFGEVCRGRRKKSSSVLGSPQNQNSTFLLLHAEVTHWPVCDFVRVGQAHSVGNSSHPTELVLGLVCYPLSPVAVVTRVTVGHGYGAAVTVPGVTLQGFELWHTGNRKNVKSRCCYISWGSSAVLTSHTRGQHHVTQTSWLKPLRTSCSLLQDKLQNT